MRKFVAAVALAIVAIALTPKFTWACACGCGVFDVATGTMFPTGEGGTAWLEEDYMNQNRNWSGTHGAPSANNDDKQIRTEFYTAGAEYMFNRKNGVMIEVPYDHRFFKTTDGLGDIVGFNHAALGDIRIRGIYTGFSPDLSSGLTYGLKLNTGDSSYPNFDRDTSIGTGSTDVLIGGYSTGGFARYEKWMWFFNGQVDQPFKITGGYRPGAEFDAVAGVYYHHIQVGKSRVIPIAQLIGSYRVADTGPAANTPNSGYQRILLAPAVEIHTTNFRIYGQIGIPIYQNMNGNQLVAPQLFKVTVSHDF